GDTRQPGPAHPGLGLCHPGRARARGRLGPGPPDLPAGRRHAGGRPPRRTSPDALSGEPSLTYRALFAVPGFTRVIGGLLLSRLGSQMVSLAMVLFVLGRYHSPALAGFTVFAALAPGIVISPLAGALLDRHGRKWLIVLDQVVAAVALFLIGALALSDRLPPPLLVGIVLAQSLTFPLSTAGARTLLPMMVPRLLWDRVNAVDSGLYVVATLVGPPIAGGLVAAAGGPAAIIMLGLVFAASAVVMSGLRDPETDVTTSGSLAGDALAGLRY